MDFRFFENFRALKLGPGVVSKNVFAFTILIAGLACFMFATHDERLRAAALALMVGSYMMYHIANFQLMKRHPELCLLEGAELVTFLRAQQGVLSMPEVALTDAATNPSRPDPRALPPPDPL